jgi:hypothetical protein
LFYNVVSSASGGGVDRVFENMRRLDMRGPASRRVVVDAEGAMLGPDCVLVRRTAAGYRPLRREDAAAIESILAEKERDPDWLFRLSCGIAEALNNGELALAQIYGLRIPISGLDNRQIELPAVAARIAKANFNPDQPRDSYGRWTDEGGGGSGSPPVGPPAAGDGVSSLARISQRGGCIGALDLRKSNCQNGLAQGQGNPDANRV